MTILYSYRAILKCQHEYIEYINFNESHLNLNLTFILFLFQINSIYSKLISRGQILVKVNAKAIYPQTQQIQNIKMIIILNDNNKHNLFIQIAINLNLFIIFQKLNKVKLKSSFKSLQARRIQIMNTKQLKQFIESQVFDILTDIKDQIQNKIKDIDSNILMMKKDIQTLLKNSQNTDNKNQVNINKQMIQQRLSLIQKQLMLIKQNSIMSTNMNLYNHDFKDKNNLKNKISNNTEEQFYHQNTKKQLQKTLPFNKQTQKNKNKNNELITQILSQTYAKNNKSYSKQSNRGNVQPNFAFNSNQNTTNSPQIFKRTSQNSFDLNSVLFDDLQDDSHQFAKQQTKKNFYYPKTSDEGSSIAITQNISLAKHSNNLQYNEKQSNTQKNSKNFKLNNVNIIPPIVNKNKQKKPPLPTSTLSNNPNSAYVKNKQIQTNTKQLPIKIVEKQLSKNKNSFLRKKSNSQGSNLVQEQQVYVRECEQVNLELEYSKDSIDGFNTEKEKTDGYVS